MQQRQGKTDSQLKKERLLPWAGWGEFFVKSAFPHFTSRWQRNTKCDRRMKRKNKGPLPYYIFTRLNILDNGAKIDHTPSLCIISVSSGPLYESNHDKGRWHFSLQSLKPRPAPIAWLLTRIVPCGWFFCLAQLSLHFCLIHIHIFYIAKRSLGGSYVNLSIAF